MLVYTLWMHPLLGFSCCLFIAFSAAAQNGDRASEPQRDLPEEWKTEIPNPLSPQEALQAFTVAPGYEVQLVAAEPMIQAPVQIAFDGDGSLWVLEMRGYMPNADGTDELRGIGRVVNLRDTDQDGVMDKSTVFLDGLVLPRAIAPTHNGLLVVESPNLLYARDTTGDGVADETTILISGFTGIQSPEHGGNGLCYGIDNVFETTQHNRSFWFNGETIKSRRVGAHGQWGVTRDDYGRLFYSPNSDPLIGDRVPKHYAARNPETGGLDGVPERYANDKRTWPVHMTPGVNRGYNTTTLRKDGTLAHFTAACGPEIFRGEALGESVYGDAFVCETVGNLVKQYDLSEENGQLRATQVYENEEFLASTDERFRPVNLLTGPDGALYIVDMYRGVVQHRIFMTTWLRKQVEARELELPLDLGRIWRVVKKGSVLKPIEDLANASIDRLIDIIETHQNGALRDTAQRLLVESNSLEGAGRLRLLAMNEEIDDYRRIQAAWTLNGLGSADAGLVEQLAQAIEPSLRSTAARLAEDVARHEAEEVLAGLLNDENSRVRLQAILSAGELPNTEAFGLLDAALRSSFATNSYRKAVYSGVGGREAEFLAAMSEPAGGGWLARNGAGQRRVLRDLADAALKRGSLNASTALMALATRRVEAAPWQTMVIYDAVAAYTRAGTKKTRPLWVKGEPRAWHEQIRTPEHRLQSRAVTIDPLLRWSGREGFVNEAVDESANGIIARGKRLYGHCLSCHQPNGRGLPPIYPPLDESPFVNGKAEQLAAILLHGLSGRIKVQGQTYNQLMPPAPLQSDADIAAVMSYIRQAWNNVGDPVDAAFVGTVREAIKGHQGPWSATELETINLSP